MFRFSLSALCAIQTSLLLQLFLLTFLLKKSEQCDAENFQWTCHLFIFIFVFSIFFSQARCNSYLHYLFKFSYFSSDIMSHTDHWSFIFPTCLGWWILIQWISHYKLEVCNQDYKLDCKLVILQWEKQNSFSFKHHLIIFPAKEIFKHQKVKYQIYKRFCFQFKCKFKLILIFEITKAWLKSSCWLLQVFLCYQMLTWSGGAKRVRGHRSATPGARHLTSLIYIHADLYSCDSSFCFLTLSRLTKRGRIYIYIYIFPAI